MKLRLLNILNSKELLERLGKEKFPSKISYIIQRNIKNINNEFVSIEEQKKSLFIKYGEDRGNGNYEILNDKKEDFFKELNDLLSQEINIDILQISLNDFDFKLSPNEMGQIEWMFNLDEI